MVLDRQKAYIDYIKLTLEPYLGMSIDNLAKHFNLPVTAKNINALIVSSLLGIVGAASRQENIKAAGIIPKTVLVQENGTVKESMSFPCFDFIELSKQTWEESDLYHYLTEHTFLFIVFKTRNDGIHYLSHIIPWKIPQDDLHEVQHVWERTAEKIRSGVKFFDTPRGKMNNLPKASESYVAHVRPHARNSADTRPLPDGRSMTKQCFWLNNKYIENIIDEYWQ